jgi:preprotein translocase subunit YajC
MTLFVGNMKFYLVAILFFLNACVPPEGDASVTQQTPGAFLFSTLYFILLAFFAYYYIVIRPSQVEEDDRKKFIDGLKKNDEVCTTGGLIGRFIQKKDSYSVIEIAPKIEIKVLSSELMKKPEQTQSNVSESKKKDNDIKKK